MPEVCNGTFTASLSHALSKNEGSSYSWSERPKTEEVAGVTMDNCNVHAFCSVCSESEGTMASGRLRINTLLII